MEQNKTYTFGTFRLDTAIQLLWCEEKNVTLTPKVYRLLLYFLCHTGRLISHEELFDAVWDGRIVDDSALRLTVNSLRNALHDDSKSPRYISTVSRRGYHFLATVTVSACYLIAEMSETNPLSYRPKVRKFSDCIGYTNELADLQAAFQKASNGERQLVFLNGEQGIGKTALLDTFLANVNHPQLAVLRARCVKMQGVTEPFLPLLEALERHCRESYGKRVIDRLNQLAPTWLYQLLTVLNPDEIAVLLTKVAHINTGRMVREGVHFFETLSNNTPLILILDNAHWSDDFTLDLFGFLMFRCSAANLLIIVSYRSCENEPAVQRIEQIQAELLTRGLCQELRMQKRCS